jgi:DNA repair protein RadC
MMISNLKLSNSNYRITSFTKGENMNLYQVAEIELVYKRGCKPSDRPTINKAEHAYRLLRDQWDKNKLEFVEQAKILLLNRANRVLGISDLSTGGISGTVIDAKLVFVTALKANACTIILAHNHPSGNLSPSPQDKQITRQLMEAGKLLNIDVIDHLIITDEGFYSFSEGLAYVV